MLESVKVVVTFESVDKILWCDHSNETSLPVLSNSAICFQNFTKRNLGIFVAFCPWPHLALKGLKPVEAERILISTAIACFEALFYFGYKALRLWALFKPLTKICKSRAYKQLQFTVSWFEPCRPSRISNFTHLLEMLRGIISWVFSFSLCLSLYLSLGWPFSW